eukprot:gene573-1104_t
MLRSGTLDIQISSHPLCPWLYLFLRCARHSNLDILQVQAALKNSISSNRNSYSQSVKDNLTSSTDPSKDKTIVLNAKTYFFRNWEQDCGLWSLEQLDGFEEHVLQMLGMGPRPGERSQKRDHQTTMIAYTFKILKACERLSFSRLYDI